MPESNHIKQLLSHLSREEAQDYQSITERMKDKTATFSPGEVRQYLIYLAKLYATDPDKILRYTYLPQGPASSKLMAKLEQHVSRLQSIVGVCSGYVQIFITSVV